MEIQEISRNMNGGTATKMGTSGKNGRKVWNHHSSQFLVTSLEGTGSYGSWMIGSVSCDFPVHYVEIHGYFLLAGPRNTLYTS